MRAENAIVKLSHSIPYGKWCKPCKRWRYACVHVTASIPFNASRRGTPFRSESRRHTANRSLEAYTHCIRDYDSFRNTKRLWGPLNYNASLFNVLYRRSPCKKR